MLMPVRWRFQGRPPSWHEVRRVRAEVRPLLHGSEVQCCGHSEETANCRRGYELAQHLRRLLSAFTLDMPLTAMCHVAVTGVWNVVGTQPRLDLSRIPQHHFGMVLHSSGEYQMCTTRLVLMVADVLVAA